MTAGGPAWYPRAVILTPTSALPQADRKSASALKSTAGPTHGKCHIGHELGQVQLVLAVGHWLCLDCQRLFLPRGLAFVKGLVGPSTLDCCGPEPLL